MRRDSSEDFMYAMQTPKQRERERARWHYTPDSINERRDMLRFVICIAVLMMLVGLAGGIAS